MESIRHYTRTRLWASAAASVNFQPRPVGSLHFSVSSRYWSPSQCAGFLFRVEDCFFPAREERGRVGFSEVSDEDEGEDREDDAGKDARFAVRARVEREGAMDDDDGKSVGDGWKPV